MGALILSPSAPPRLSPQGAILVPAGWGPEGPLPPALHTLLSGGGDGSPPPGAPWAPSTHRAWCLFFAKLEVEWVEGRGQAQPLPRASRSHRCHPESHPERWPLPAGVFSWPDLTQ